MGSHILICIIFALMTLLSFSMSSAYDKSFQLYYVLVLATFIVLAGVESDWMNKNIGTFFLFVILFAIAERSASSSYPELSDTISPFINLAIFGLSFISFCKGKTWSTLIFMTIGILDYLKKYVVYDMADIDDFSSFVDMFPNEVGPDLSLLYK